MYSPKFRPSATKQEDEGSCCTLRWCLVVWASMRLGVSLLLSAVVLLTTAVDIHKFTSGEDVKGPTIYNRLWFDIFAILVQLVESVMIVTFITAGVKKSASLYRAYYHYCILTLIIYVIAVFLCSYLNYDDGHYIGEIYLTFHINELSIIPDDYFGIAFIVSAAIDVCLEIFLIFLIRELMKIYSLTPCEDV